MSYSDYETSTFGGGPVELYEFSNGNMTWRYTSADETITHAGFSFTPEQITSAEMRDSQELNQLTIPLQVPRDNPVAQLFQFCPPTNQTTLIIYRAHRTDPSNATNFIVRWVGRVINSEYLGATVQLSCEPITTALRRLGLRRNYQRQCPHVLYGAMCGVVKDSYKLTTTATSHSGLTVNVPATLVANNYAGGMLSWVSAIGQQWRFITGNTTNTLSVNMPFLATGDPYGRDLPAGTSIDLYPGCQHTLTDCNTRFNNIANYGGFPFIPLVNPFGMTTLF